MTSNVLPPRPPEGTRWGGRSKRTPNKLNQSIRDAILHAFDEVGGAAYLVQLAKDAPKTFVPLLLKVIPPEPVQTNSPSFKIVIDLGDDEEPRRLN